MFQKKPNTELAIRRNLLSKFPTISSELKKPSVKANLSVLIITTFPPRECGIATYTKDLFMALEKIYGDSIHVEICPLLTMDDNEKEDSGYYLNPQSMASYKKLVKKINCDTTIDMVMVQHEFGLFQSNEDGFLYFLYKIDKKIILGFHTVLPKPNREFGNYVNQIIARVDHIVVMTETSKKILLSDYKIQKSVITVIHHGTHTVVFKDDLSLKTKYELEGRTILTTFGLLGPGKSIETTLDALPLLIDEYPNLLFLVLGKTHPTLLKKEAETYRNFLTKKVKDLGLDENIKFINEFLPTATLLEYLQLTDIYLFTSKDPNQAVSGTFAYAMSCGCAILSTPIPHAKEFLTEDKGRIFDFEDSEQLANLIKSLLDEPNYQKTMGLNNLQASNCNTWENSALAHGQLFDKLNDRSSLKIKKPQIELDHLYKMTDSVGIVQFANLNQPDFDSGYTVDDNARALVMVCSYFELTQDKSVLIFIETYVCFLLYCQLDNGTFLNYVNKYGVFTEQNEEVNLQDANGRCIWALGSFIALESKLPTPLQLIIKQAKDSFDRFIKNIHEFHSPRALAFYIKGVYKRFSTETNFTMDVKSVAQKLANMYLHESKGNWKWYESYMTYGNSVLPEAMLMAYCMTNEGQYKTIALESFDFLLNQLYRGGKFNIISNLTWLNKGDSVDDMPKGGQQPIDVAYTILALKTFDSYFPDRGYDKKMHVAFNWFLGKNHLNQSVYNHSTKGCHDGIENNNINLNQGAESTISYLMSRLAFV